MRTKIRQRAVILIILLNIGLIALYYRFINNVENENFIKKRNQFFETEVDFQLNDDRPSTEHLITSTESLNELKLNSHLNGVYVREAYRTLDDEIRLINLQNNNNRVTIEALIENKWVEFDSFCSNYSTCIDYQYCTMSPRISMLKLENNFDFNSTTIKISAKEQDEYYEIPLIDVRPQKIIKYKHTLGVCLQPIFYLTDWTIVIQFFESWLAQGSTKFYFYVHSYSKQVEYILNFYKSILGDNLELINWSDLPVSNENKGDYYKDPNAHVFRYGATAFMHDCMLRARYHVKYISNTDLDDLPISKYLNVSKSLEEAERRHPHAAQFLFDWFWTKQEDNWRSIKSPKSIRFNINDARILNRDDVRADYRIAKKIIHRPERVQHFDQHNVYGNEKMENGKHYTAVEMFDNPTIYFLHLRRFDTNLRVSQINSYNNTFNYNSMKFLNRKMQKQYNERIRNNSIEKLDLSPWAAQSKEVMRSLEECRLNGFGVELNEQNKLCRQSSAGCYRMLPSGIDFIKAPMTWVNIVRSVRVDNYHTGEWRFEKLKD